MKKLVLGFVIAVSLMVGIAGSAGATQADSQACSNAASNGLTAIAMHGGCGGH